METDALGGKPLVLSLVQLLRLNEAEIRGLKGQKESGQKYTLLSMSNEGEVTEPQLLDDLIVHWEKEKAYLEEVINWAESRELGSSRNGDGTQLMDEYEKLFGKN